MKELADRQSRSNADDRRLICERTAKNLRTITNPNRIYVSSNFRRMSARRSLLPTYLTAPATEMDLDDDDFDNALLDGERHAH